MRTIVLNNRIIEYDVKYNAKKNVNIRIRPDLRLNVSAPRWVLKSQLEKILNEKSSWIIHNLEKQKQEEKAEKYNVFENGHAIWLFGMKYRLYFRTDTRNYVYIMNDQIFVCSKRENDLEYAQGIFKNWLKDYAYSYYFEVLNKYKDKLRTKYKIPDFSLQVREMKTRWGTCIPSKKKITLNLSLMYTPQKYLEYVALHELIHFLEIYHNEHFYSIFEEFMPDYKERQVTLNREYSRINR
jgi:predicted metal-dependent hydrolase